MTDFVSSKYEEEKILQVVADTFQGGNILVIEDSPLLPKLRHMLLKTPIYAVDTEEDSVRVWKDFQIDGKILDYRSEVLPFAKKYFDLIIAPHAFEEAYLARDIAYGLRTFLKDEGILLASFFNVRFLPILEALRKGTFPLFHLHAFSRREIESLFFSVFYQEITFFEIKYAFSKKRLAPFMREDFAFFDELLVASYIVVVKGELSATSSLKKGLASKERYFLSKILRRIAYDICTKDNLTMLFKLLEENITPSYLAKFILLMTLEKEKLVRILLDMAEKKKNRIFKKEFLKCLVKESEKILRQNTSSSETLNTCTLSEEFLKYLDTEYQAILKDTSKYAEE